MSSPAPPILLLIFDGLGDRPCSKLNGKTPLEAAATPHLDALAAEGICGLQIPVARGVPVGSDTGHLALLGYEARQVYTGRGPFEATGIGLAVEPGDVAFRVNFATLEEGKVVDRRAGRIREGTKELLEPLQGRVLEGVEIRLAPSVEHRAALVLHGKGLGDAVSDLDPHQTGVPVPPSRAKDRKSQKTARVLNALFTLSGQLLASHPVNRERVRKGLPPANALLFRGGGQAPHIPSFEKEYGLCGGCVAETGLVRGVGVYVGLQEVSPQGATGGLDTDCQALVRASLQLLEQVPFCLLNYKACDIASHDGDPELKKKLVEKMDAALSPLVEKVKKGELLLGITGDHSTPCALKEHSGDPVPLLLAGPGVRTDSVQRFGERSCALGGLGHLKGREILPTLLDLAGRREKFGA